MSGLTTFVLGAFAGLLCGVLLHGCVADDNRAHSAYACRAAGPEQHWQCIDFWYASRKLEPPWPSIRAADRERVTAAGRIKVKPKLGGL